MTTDPASPTSRPAARGVALVRPPGPRLADGIVTHIERSPVDVALAREQHAGYVAALESALAQRSEEPAVSAPTQRPYAWAEPAPEAEDIGLRAACQRGWQCGRHAGAAAARDADDLLAHGAPHARGA